MADRPVYIPSGKRKKKKQFFHGAFEGGFSAGFHDTVGSREGWTPREDTDAVAQRQQKPEDFMDDQDHNEWGGPTSVREEYADSSADPPSVKLDPMLDLVKPPAQNVGHRLLRILGWRDGSTAYVPHEEALLRTPLEQSVESLLSSRRLKKIQLQQSRVQIPNPKLDTCGLGYEPYQNAPEFRAHKERRRKEAQERAKAVTASSAANRNVYRLSNLLADNEDEDDDTRQRHTTNREVRDDPLASFETEESFVGTKTVGGFALREDDDDVYDDNAGKVSKINHDEYDTVVYEHASDAEDDNNKEDAVTGEEFGYVFASWATSKPGEQKPSASRGITSNGRPPLSGFVLGASATPSMTKRYPGPNIPAGYEPKRHEFATDEHPGAWKDESHVAQQELMVHRRKTAQAERRADILKREKERENGPMAGVAFAGLAAAMKNRFTSSAPDAAENGGPIGLQQPNANETVFPTESVAVKETVSKPITIKRTTMTFAPETLLCKRFQVVAPANAQQTFGSKQAAVEPKGEASYFTREILSKAGVPGTLATKTLPDAKGKSATFQEKLLGDDGTIEDPSETRPSMKVLESIFEPQSESESEDNSEEALETGGTKDKISGNPTYVLASPPPGIPEGVLAPAESVQGVPKDVGERERGSDSRKHRRKRSKDDDERKRRRRKSRSRSPSSSSDGSRRKRSRKREEKKKRKKSHKSSLQKS